ncbi:MAG: peptide deformylase [Gaiellaceae bacterium]
MNETTVDDQTGDAAEELSDESAAQALDPEEQARRAYALAQVRQYPDTALRMKAREVEEFDDALAGLAERMTSVMQDARGVGLAAPQVGVLQRMFVYQAAAEAAPTVIVNPTVVDASEEKELAQEGCLSLGRASVNVDVERSVEIKVEGKTPAGESIVVEATELEARVIQHELDHLDGILIIDHASPEQRRDAMAELRPKPGVRGGA